MLMADRPDSVAVAGRTGRAGLLRHLSILLALAACLSVSSTGPGASQSGPIDATTEPQQRTIAEVTNDIESGRLSGAALAEAYLERGDIWARKEKQYERAISDFGRAIDLNPKLAKALSHRGIARIETKQLDDAVADFTQAIAVGAGNADLYKYYMNRGRAFSDKGDHQRAIADENQAIQLNAHAAGAFLLRGSAWELAGDLDQALSDYGSAADLPKMAIAYYGRALIWNKKGDNTRALDEINRAIEADAKFSPLYNVRGEVLRLQHQYQSAIADYSRAIEINEGVAVYHYNRGLALAELGESSRAAADFDRAIALDPNMAEVYSERGRLRSKEHDYQRAIVDFDRAIQLNPRSAIFYVNRGQAFSDQHQYERSITDFDRAIELDPKLAMAYNNRGWALAESEQNERALADLDRAIALDRRWQSHTITGASSFFGRGGSTRRLRSSIAAFR